MELLTQYSLFFLKTITFLLAFLALFAGIFTISRKPKPKLDIISLNETFDEMTHQMQHTIHNTPTKKSKKSKKTKNKTKHDAQSIVFVIDFQGDIKATQVDQLRQEVTAILSIATSKDEVFLRLESPGGTVNGYGLAASQLQRIRDNKIPLTVSIDKIAASGGYLMACVANHIMAAPFAIVGSIGVVAQLPNIHRWLKKQDIDVEQITAGEYKRTLTVLGHNTPKGRQKFQEDLDKIHQAFRDYLINHRTHLDIDQVSTGEFWLGRDALSIHLVDSLQTSDDYLSQKARTHRVFQISIQSKLPFLAKLLKPVMHKSMELIRSLLPA